MAKFCSGKLSRVFISSPSQRKHQTGHHITCTLRPLKPLPCPPASQSPPQPPSRSCHLTLLHACGQPGRSPTAHASCVGPRPALLALGWRPVGGPPLVIRPATADSLLLALLRRAALHSWLRAAPGSRPSGAARAAPAPAAARRQGLLHPLFLSCLPATDCWSLGRGCCCRRRRLTAAQRSQLPQQRELRQRRGIAGSSGCQDDLEGGRVQARGCCLGRRGCSLRALILRCLLQTNIK